MANHSKKPHQRTIDKVNLLVRMELANPLLSSTDIALLCGLKINRFSVLKKSPYYQQIHNQYMTGVISDLDLIVKNNLNMTQKTLEFAVPVAMQNLLKQALQEKDLRVQNKACNDLLDRHGRFPKITRQDIALKDSNSIAEDKDNRAVQEMVQALSKMKSSTHVTPAPSIDTPPLTESTQ